jgi:hypothetical protein
MYLFMALEPTSAKPILHCPSFGRNGPASRIPASAKSPWIVQGQNVGQRDLCPHTFYLLQQGHLGVNFLGDLLDPSSVFRQVPGLNG